MTNAPRDEESRVRGDVATLVDDRPGPDGAVVNRSSRDAMTPVRGDSPTSVDDGAPTSVGLPTAENRALFGRVMARISGREAPPEVLFDRYEFIRRLGAGGMGVVYLARDPELDRQVALKLVQRDLADGDAGRLRLQREAQALAKLAHPNVVAVYDVGEHGGQVWISMEFVVGRTLGEWLEDERPRWRQVLAVVMQAGRGLAAAHAEGLLHRDIKPDNIMVGYEGNPLYPQEFCTLGLIQNHRSKNSR